MENSPRDLVIKVFYPNNVSDTFDWCLKQTVFSSTKMEMCIQESKSMTINFHGASNYSEKFRVTSKLGKIIKEEAIGIKGM